MRIVIPADRVVPLLESREVVDVVLQNPSATSVFLSTRQSDLFRVDAGGNPVAGIELTSAAGIQRYESFRGALWARAALAQTEIEIQVNPT